MSKDEALEKWLEAELLLLAVDGKPALQGPRGQTNTHYRFAATAAWHAAVKHTLEHISCKLMKDQRARQGIAFSRLIHDEYMRYLAGDIRQMKP